MATIDRFLTWGARAFTVHTSWSRVAFQPILFLFMWAAAIRILLGTGPPIQFSELLSQYGENIWTVTSLICPPLALLAWWLVAYCQLPRSTLAGLWLRLGSDIGQCCVVLIYHVVAVFTATSQQREDTVYSRYIVGATIAFLFGLLLRDIWALIMVERVAAGLRRDE